MNGFSLDDSSWPPKCDAVDAIVPTTKAPPQRPRVHAVLLTPRSSARASDLLGQSTEAASSFLGMMRKLARPSRGASSADDTPAPIPAYQQEKNVGAPRKSPRRRFMVLLFAFARFFRNLVFYDNTRDIAPSSFVHPASLSP